MARDGAGAWAHVTDGASGRGWVMVEEVGPEGDGMVGELPLSRPLMQPVGLGCSSLSSPVMKDQCLANLGLL